MQESDELYLVSETGDNVKIRAELMDIKALRAVDNHGLQQWEPVLKATFPLDSAEIATTFEALRQPLPTPAPNAYSQPELLEELVDRAAVRLVSAQKRRVRYMFNECMLESTDIAVGDRRTRTLAIETEDPAAVWAAVTSLGLGERVNTSVPQGLLALVGDERPRYAVIDVGTNSVKFHVGEQRDDGTWRRVVDRAELSRLGEGLAESGVISAAALGTHDGGDHDDGRGGTASSRPGDRGGGHGRFARCRQPRRRRGGDRGGDRDHRRHHLG